MQTTQTAELCPALALGLPGAAAVPSDAPPASGICGVSRSRCRRSACLRSSASTRSRARFYLSFFDYSVVDPPRPSVSKTTGRSSANRDFTTSLFNSFRYVVFTYIPVWILALLLALALNTRIRARAIFRTIYFVPVVMSWVVVSVIWKLIFHRNGLLNTMFLDPVGIAPQELADRHRAGAGRDRDHERLEGSRLFHGRLPGRTAKHPVATTTKRQESMARPVLQVFRYITLPLLQPTILFSPSSA